MKLEINIRYVINPVEKNSTGFLFKKYYSKT